MTVRTGSTPGLAILRSGARPSRRPCAPRPAAAQVGNSGESDVPHLHMHVHNRPYDYTGNENNLFTYPMTFRNTHVNASGLWPRPNAGELRSGDRIRPASQQG